MKKVFFNILIMVAIFFIFDYTIYKINIQKYNLPYSYMFTKKIAVSDENDKDYIDNMLKFREPNIVPNSDKKPIVFTGCSFVYGTGLTDKQTITYKISDLLNTSVYNFGMCSYGINTFITLLKMGIFFDKVKEEPSLVIYIYIGCHLKRIVMPNMYFERNEFLYKPDRNNHLVRKRPPFIISHSALLSSIRSFIFDINFEYNKQYQKYLLKLLKIHILEAKRLINEKYPDTKFLVLLYFDSPLFEQIAPDLEKEGIIIIRVIEELGIDPHGPEYQLPDGHPNEKIWNEIAPLLANRLKEYL